MEIYYEEIANEFSNYFGKLLNKSYKTPGSKLEMFLIADRS